MTQSYKSIKSISEGLYKEKGSKFYGYAIPVKTEDEIKEHLEELRKRHHDCRHVCYAWMLGYEREHYRANDDGEPNNSAGKPILGQIESFGLTNILVAVVRYFGGTKLGVGGLISAYKISAKEAIENGEIVEETVKKYLEIDFDFIDMPMVMNLIKDNSIEIIKQEFETECKLGFLLELNQVDFMKSKFSDFPSLIVKEEKII